MICFAEICGLQLALENCVMCVISAIVILTTNLVFCQSAWHLNQFSAQSKILIAVHNAGVFIFMQTDCALETLDVNGPPRKIINSEIEE